MDETPVSPFDVIFRALMPIATTAAMGLPRVCTALAEKGLLDSVDIMKVSHGAMLPFDRATGDLLATMPGIARTVDHLRQAIENEWLLAEKAAYHYAKENRPSR